MPPDARVGSCGRIQENVIWRGGSKSAAERQNESKGKRKRGKTLEKVRHNESFQRVAQGRHDAFLGLTQLMERFFSVKMALATFWISPIVTLLMPSICSCGKMSLSKVSIDVP